MSKKYKWKKKSYKKGLSEKQKLLAKLHKMVNSGKVDGKDKAVARSLIAWYLRQHGLSSRQWDYADVIIRRFSGVNNSKQADKKQYLYGISDGNMIKLGMSCDIKKRLEALQTSNPRNLKIVWEYYTGKCTKTARALERKLHRRCKKYRVRGEWFELECFGLVKLFTGENRKRAHPLLDNDIEIIKQSQKMG